MSARNPGMQGAAWTKNRSIFSIFRGWAGAMAERRYGSGGWQHAFGAVTR
jgi:hypothetical protein